MKNQIIKLLMGALLLPLATMAQDHSGHTMAMNDGATKITQYEVSAKFQKQLNAVYQAGLEMNLALVADDAKAAKERAGTMIHRVTEVDMALIEGEAHMAWMENLKVLSDELDKMMVSNDINVQRKSYAKVSEELYKAIKSFGIGETVYYMHCPMFKANWLTDTDAIENPYYGNKMLNCGSIADVIN